MFELLKGRKSNKERVDELLSAYLDGQLAPTERARLEARLAREPALRRRLDELRRTVEALKRLPPVALPRNFILSPSMVDDAKPVPRQRRRWSWPALGWATAIVTLLFLLVLAGDFLFVPPSVRREPSNIVAQQSEQVEPRPGEGELQALGGVTTEAKDLAPPEMDEPETAAGMEKSSAEEPAAVAEAEVETEPSPQPLPSPEISGEVVEEEAPMAVPPAEEPMPMVVGTPGEMLHFSEWVSPTGAPVEGGRMAPEVTSSPVPSNVVTAPLVVEEQVVVTPGLPTAEPSTEVPRVVSPPEEIEDRGGDAGPSALQEYATVPSTPGQEISPVEEAQEKPAGTPTWLRLLEVGLGLLVVGLALATLITYRRAI